MHTTETADHDHNISRPFSFEQKSKSRLTVEYIFLTIAILAFIAASFMAASQYAVMSR